MKSVALKENVRCNVKFVTMNAKSGVKSETMNAEFNVKMNVMNRDEKYVMLNKNGKFAGKV